MLPFLSRDFTQPAGQAIDARRALFTTCFFRVDFSNLPNSFVLSLAYSPIAPEAPDATGCAAGDGGEGGIDLRRGT